MKHKTAEVKAVYLLLMSGKGCPVPTALECANGTGLIYTEITVLCQMCTGQHLYATFGTKFMKHSQMFEGTLLLRPNDTNFVDVKEINCS